MGNNMDQTPSLILPDKCVLQLYRYLWQPARYAHPDWMRHIGFQNKNWQYGQHSVLDKALNNALQNRRGTPVLNARLTQRQQRLVDLVPKMDIYALSLGLIKMACTDYFLLPDYRTVLLPLLGESLIWKLFGLSCGHKHSAIPPDQLVNQAMQIGIAALYCLACHEPVLYATLIVLPPPGRALWPQGLATIAYLLEYIL